MSHFVCPLCGKNAPLSKFDPSSLDLDLKIVSFKGLGRGLGFEKSDEVSVLGDDKITPVVADRVVDLCKMLVDEGAIDWMDLCDRLEIKKKLKDSGEVVDKKDFDELASRSEKEVKSLRDQVVSRDRDIKHLKNELETKDNYLKIFLETINDLNNKLKEKSNGEWIIKYSIEEITEKYELEKMIDILLLEILSWIRPDIVCTTTSPWRIIIPEIDRVLLNVLIDTIAPLSDDVRGKLKERIEAYFDEDKELLDKIMNFPRRKRAVEKMLEVILDYDNSKDMWSPTLYKPSTTFNDVIRIVENVREKYKELRELRIRRLINEY